MVMMKTKFWENALSLNKFHFSIIKIVHMSSLELNERINKLPKELQKQVADFVEFLMLKYKSDSEEELTEEQKSELLQIWSDYEKNPEDALTPEELLNSRN